MGAEISGLVGSLIGRFRGPDLGLEVSGPTRRDLAARCC